MVHYERDRLEQPALGRLMQSLLTFGFNTAILALGSAAPVRSLQQQSFIRTPLLAGPHEP